MLTEGNNLSMSQPELKVSADPATTAPRAPNPLKRRIDEEDESERRADLRSNRPPPADGGAMSAILSPSSSHALLAFTAIRAIRAAPNMAPMEDYEVANARTWDDTIAAPPEEPEQAIDDGSGWQEVGNTKQRKQKQKQKQNKQRQQQKVASRPSAFQQPSPVRPQQQKVASRPSAFQQPSPVRPQQGEENQPPRPDFRLTGQDRTAFG